jgi:hypothetical protein
LILILHPASGDVRVWLDHRHDVASVGILCALAGTGWSSVGAFPLEMDEIISVNFEIGGAKVVLDRWVRLRGVTTSSSDSNIDDFVVIWNASWSGNDLESFKLVI